MRLHCFEDIMISHYAKDSSFKNHRIVTTLRSCTQGHSANKITVVISFNIADFFKF